MKRVYYILLLLLYFGITKAQEVGANAPTNSGFIEALKTMISDKDENLYTGNINVKIPLYTYKDQDFEIPISIENSSTGYKTYQRIESLGIGWNLNVGGHIVRQINGVPDEKTTFFSCVIPNSNAATIYGYKAWSIFTDNTFDELIAAGKGMAMRNTATQEYNFGIETNNGGSPFFVETTPDLFTFNFLGHTGKFIKNEFGTFNIFDTSNPEGEYKIEILNFGDGNYPNENVKIKITTGDGYKYIFEDKNVYYSNAMSFNRPGHVYDTNSTYYPLVEINAPNGRKVSFEYFDKETNTISHYYFSKDADWNVYGDGTPAGIGKGYLTTAEFVLPIKKITIDDIWINFAYGNQRQEKVDLKPNYYDRYPQNDYTYLKSVGLLSFFTVEKKDINGIYFPFKTFNFNYIYGKDTGYTTSRQVPLLKKVDISGEGDYNMDYYNEDKVFPPLTYGRDYWGYWNGTGVINSFPTCNTDLQTNIETNQDVNYLPNFNFSIQGMLKKLKYPTGGYTCYYYEPHDYSRQLVKDLRDDHKNQSYLETVGNKTAGGVRIKRVTNYSSSTDSTYVDYEYYLQKPKANLTGILLHTPRFYREVNYNYDNKPERIKHISWLNDFMSSEDNVNVAYSKVIKRYPDNSYSLYSFSDYSMFPDLPHNSSITIKKRFFNITSPDLQYADNFFANNISRHRIRGKLLSKTDYNKNNYPTHSEQYNYDFDKFNKDLTEQEKYSYPYPLESEYNIYTVSEAFSYFYVQKTITRSFPLISKTETTYANNEDLSSSVEKTTKFYYNNIGQLTEKQVIQSDGSIIKIKTKYPYDLRTNSGWANIYDHMFDNNFIAYPIQIETSILNKGLTSIVSNTYLNIGDNENVFYKLSEQKKSELQKPYDTSSGSDYINFNTEMIFSYYKNGNIKEITDKNNLTTTYLWGYNNQYPIAEIKNASYSQVSSALSKDPLKISAETSPDMSIVDGLRNKLTNSMINTYVYKPLVGLTSATDQRGVTARYIYDAANRLALNRDYNNNVLAKYRYNFSNAPSSSSDTPSPLSAVINKNDNTYFKYENTATVQVNGGSGNIGYSWYLKNASGTVLASSVNSGLAKFVFTPTQIGALTLECVVTDYYTNQTMSCSKSINCVYAPLIATINTDNESYPKARIIVETPPIYNSNCNATIVITGGSLSYTVVRWEVKNNENTIIYNSATPYYLTNYSFPCTVSGTLKISCYISDNVTHESKIINKNITVY